MADTLTRRTTHRRASLASIPPSAGPAATARLFELHNRLCAGHTVNAVALSAETEFSARTIKRDIEFLRDRCKAPVVWDAKLKSYRYTAPFDLASGLRLDAEEALAVVLAGNTFAAWGGTPLGRTLTVALEKIARFAGPALSFPAADLRAVLHRDETALDAPEHRHFAALLEHILARRELVILYQKPDAPRPERRAIRPLHLAYLEHRWMLIAEDTRKKAWRNFLLPRIHAIERTVRTFTPPVAGKIKHHLAGSLGRFTGDQEIGVRLRFTATAAHYLRERPWHASQTITDLPGGAIEVTLRLNNLIDVQRRILANGRHVEVLSPPELRQAIATEIATLARIYAPELAAAKQECSSRGNEAEDPLPPPPKKSSVKKIQRDIPCHPASAKIDGAK
ncbi:MAG: WYL domain-containing protein [Opitutaceae bacterium]|jgi:predicted DNA-binding transcriptional regulator YafY